MTEHPLTTAERMAALLDEISNEDVARGARRLVWEQRAEWAPGDVGTMLLLRSNDDEPLLEVVLADSDWSSTDAFWQEVER